MTRSRRLKVPQGASLASNLFSVNIRNDVILLYYDVYLYIIVHIMSYYCIIFSPK